MVVLVLCRPGCGDASWRGADGSGNGPPELRGRLVVRKHGASRGSNGAGQTWSRVGVRRGLWSSEVRNEYVRGRGPSPGGLVGRT